MKKFPSQYSRKERNREGKDSSNVILKRIKKDSRKRTNTKSGEHFSMSRVGFETLFAYITSDSKAKSCFRVNIGEWTRRRKKANSENACKRGQEKVKSSFEWCKAHFGGAMSPQASTKWITISGL
jgi:hypothetical protein